MDEFTVFCTAKQKVARLQKEKSSIKHLLFLYFKGLVDILSPVDDGVTLAGLLEDHVAGIVIGDIGCIAQLVDHLDGSVFAVKLISDSMTVGKGDDVVLHISVVGIRRCIAVGIGYSGLLVVAVVGRYDSLSVSIDYFEQVATQLSREPRKLPKMKINPEVKSIFDFKYEDFELVDYDPYPRIPAPVAV